MAFISKTITLGDKAADLLRPYVIDIVRRNISNTQDYEALYEAQALADAFSILPRDIGFAFDTWKDYREERERILNPGYAEMATGGMNCVPGKAWH
jgi:hypothetical protein